MLTLTIPEAIKWCAKHRIVIDAQGNCDSAFNDFEPLRFEIPKAASRLYWFSNVILEKLQPWDECLLFVSAYGIWESSENWNLYYRLRRSYSDDRLIEEAPGHLFCWKLWGSPFPSFPSKGSCFF